MALTCCYSVKKQKKKKERHGSDSEGVDSEARPAVMRDNPVPAVSSERFAETDPSLLAEVFQASKSSDQPAGAFSLFGAMEPPSDSEEEGEAEGIMILVLLLKKNIYAYLF